MNIFEAPTYDDEIILNMNIEDISFPYTDRKAYYNGKTHRYELKEEALNEIDNGWKKKLTDKSANGVKTFFNLVTLKFYKYAYTHSRSSNSQINYLIAKRGLKSYPNNFEYRNAVIDAMVELAFYLLDNGDLASVSGVDLESMTSMSIETMRYEERDYPQRFKQTMVDIGLAYFGRYKFLATGCGEEW